MTLAELLEGLLDLVREGPPSAAQVEEHLRAAATERTVAGPNHDHPAWLSLVGDASDVYLTLSGDVAGVRVHEDPRGWGAYADVVVHAGTLADVESVVGPTEAMARNPDDFSSGERAAAYVWRNGWTVRVFTELAADRIAVRQVTLSYPSRSTVPRPRPTPVSLAQPVRPPAPDAIAEKTCAGCGAINRGDAAFCANCGRFLEW